MMNEQAINATLAAVSNQRNNALNEAAQLAGELVSARADIEGMSKIISDQADEIKALQFPDG